MATFYIYSLGCKVNTYELESIKESLLFRGYQLVSEIKEADYIIINTCCVTNTAQKKSRQRISSFRAENPNAYIIAMGCYVQGYEDEIRQNLDVNLLVGTKDRLKIVDAIEHLEIGKQISLVNELKKEDIYEELKLSSYSENTRAYLKIQDGCNNFCSYCIIPYVRGRIKSRNKQEIIDEAKQFIQQGYKEIVLIGIHTGSYGKDLKNYTFSDLVEELLNLPGLYRLRISSIEESELDDKFIELMMKNEKLARHLHIPLQAGSDHVLGLMNRKYNLKTYMQRIQEFQNKIPNIAITTDIIVGFPQETDEDFLSTLAVSKQLGFAKIHVFPYSIRKHTVAATMEGQINGMIKKQRAAQLLQLSSELTSQFNQKYLNQVLEILVETIDNGYAIGHSSNFIKIKCKINTTKVTKNDIIKTRIIKLDKEIAIAIKED